MAVLDAARLAQNRLERLNIPLPACRYQWESPGDLLHLDIKKLGRFKQFGYCTHGDRRRATPGAGWEFVNMSIDDASRVAFAEILANERQERVVFFLSAALGVYKSHGIMIRRVLTDNGSGYFPISYRYACTELGLKPPTRPYTSRSSGKVERYIQTALCEWAYAASYAHSNEKANELPRWLHKCNFYRNRSAL